MSVNVHLIDGFGNKVPVRISKRGELISAPFDYDLPTFKEVDEINEEFNFIGPLQGKQFVITGLIAIADISGNDDASVVFYESDFAQSPSPILSISASKTIYKDILGSGDRTVLLELNILTNPGVFINVMTTIATINVTVLGHYIPQI